jgi:hypothetical protein
VDRLGDGPRDDRSRTPQTPPGPGSRGSSTTRNEPAPAPVLIIRDLVENESPELAYSNKPSPAPYGDIIFQGLLSYTEAMSLVAIFQEHYGRWVAFDDSVPVEALLAKIRKSDLLLSACCLIAVRHTTQELATRLAPILFERAKALLSAALLTAPQSLEFFQATLILSFWSTSAGQTPLSIDSWLLSGFALQHCLTSNLFDEIVGNRRNFVRNHELLTRWSVWIHLCLVHLQYGLPEHLTGLS